jgi:hypothetical protein
MSATDTARRIAGDNSRVGRSELDFYPTPHKATQALLDREVFHGTIWEPACGKGDISEVLLQNDYDVLSSDIADYGYGQSDVDFLSNSRRYKQSDNIITNPPFKLALEFVEKSKQYARYKIAMFLKTAFLEGSKRHSMFQDREFALHTVYQFSKRVNFGQFAGTHKNGGMIPFAWFVWERGYDGKPNIEWIL